MKNYADLYLFFTASLLLLDSNQCSAGLNILKVKSRLFMYILQSLFYFWVWYKLNIQQNQIQYLNFPLV